MAASSVERVQERTFYKTERQLASEQSRAREYERKLRERERVGLNSSGTRARLEASRARIRELEGVRVQNQASVGEDVYRARVLAGVERRVANMKTNPKDYRSGGSSQGGRREYTPSVTYGGFENPRVQTKTASVTQELRSQPQQSSYDRVRALTLNSRAAQVEQVNAAFDKLNQVSAAQNAASKRYFGAFKVRDTLVNQRLSARNTAEAASVSALNLGYAFNAQNKTATPREKKGIVAGLRKTATRDIQRGEYFAQQARELRSQPQPSNIFARQARRAKIGGYEAAARGNVLLGTGTFTSAGTYESITNVPRNALSFATGAAFGGAERFFDRLALKQGAAKTFGNFGRVASRAGGVTLGAFYAYEVRQDLKGIQADSNVGTARQYGDILGRSAVDVVAFGLGNKAVKTAIPRTPYETTGIPIGDIKVRVRGGTEFKTSGSDLTRATNMMSGSEYFGRQTATLKFQERYAGLRGLRGEVVTTTLTRRPTGYLRRVSVGKYGRTVTTQQPQSPYSIVGIETKKSVQTFKGQSIRGREPYTVSGELFVEQRRVKNKPSDILLQEQTSLGEIGIQTQGYRGVLEARSRARTVSIAQNPVRAEFDVFTAGKKKGKKKITRVLGSQLVGRELFEGSVGIGKREDVLFQNFIETQNAPRSVLFAEQSTSGKTRAVFARQRVEIASKPEVVTFGSIRTRARGVLTAEQRFSSLGAREGRVRFTRQREVGGLKVGRVSSETRLRATLPDLQGLRPKQGVLFSAFSQNEGVRSQQALFGGAVLQSTSVRQASLGRMSTIPQLQTSQTQLTTGLTGLTSLTSLAQVTQTGPSPGVLSPGIPTITPLPPVGIGPLPTFGYAASKVKEGRGRARSFRYAPSLNAVLFKIKGRAPKNPLSGFETRPLLR